MNSALEVAKWFYKNNEQVKSDSKRGNVVVQKLCYYAQAMSLAVLNRPLFEEKIEAWKEGPVVDKVYFNYRWYTPILRFFVENTIFILCLLKYNLVQCIYIRPDTCCNNVC